ncbi:hypothetical protein E4U42_007361 [Claviceps africana]|uniref:Uncharacterized protein n=1 Tax=Claviceps africana TaxID=83212 RepID=A0A8K0J177_9HYPO|nr:hypothetical protein E4U42_007361 [Claviceps africana]
MNLTIPTPEGPFESIHFLGDRMDWPVWYDDVTDIAHALDIWKYVNPDSQHDVRPPTKPSLPTRPVLKSVTKREQFESDKTFDMRLDHERYAHALAVREYHLLCEQYRVDSARHLADLAEYTASKDHVQKLYRIIYRSISSQYRAYLKLDAATTPRAILVSLRTRITPPADKDHASAALRTYNSKLHVQPTDDKQAFIEAIALATVDLHRFKGGRFDEGTAVKDLLRSLHVLDEDFADIWLKKEGRRAVLDIVEDFKYNLRRQGQGQGHKGFSAHLPRDDHSPEGKTPEPASTSTAVNGNHTGTPHGSANDFFAPSRSNGTWARTESFHENSSRLDWSEDHALSVFNSNNNKPKRDDVVAVAGSSPTSPAYSTFSRREAPKAARNEDSGSGFSKKKGTSTNGTSAPASSKLDKHSSSASASSSKPKKSSDAVKLVMKDCPGCELKHLIRDDAWWENCYIYWALSGVGNIPNHFHAQERRLDLAFSRLKDCPDEKRRAEQWASSKGGRTDRRSGNATAGNGNASNHNKAAGRHDAASHQLGSVAGAGKGKSKGKGKGKGNSAFASAEEPQGQSQTEEFNLW